MLAFANGLRGAMGAQAGRAWRPYLAGELYGKTVGILGLGAIGSYVAKLAKADGMRVLAIRRSAQERAAWPALCSQPSRVDFTHVARECARPGVRPAGLVTSVE